MLNRATASLLPGHVSRRIGRLPMPVILGGLILLSLLLVARLAGGAVERLAHAPAASHDPTPAIVDVGGARLAVPRHMIRPEAEPGRGHPGIELHLHWPSLQGYTAERSALFKAGASSHGIIYISVRSDGTGLSPQERLQSLYPRLLSDDVRRLPGDIVVRGFRDGFGYDGEALYIASDSAQPLVARCSDREELVPANCLSGFHTEAGLEVSYRFPLALLEDWRRLDAELRALFAEFLALAAAQ